MWGQKQTWEHIFWGHRGQAKGQAENEHTRHQYSPPLQPVSTKQGQDAELSPWAAAGPGLAFTCSPPVWSGCGSEGPIWAHPVLCKFNAAEKWQNPKGPKERVFHQESLFLPGCLCLCVSFFVCVGGRHLSPSSPVFFSHSAWAPVPLCLGFHFLSIL